MAVQAMVCFFLRASKGTPPVCRLRFPPSPRAATGAGASTYRSSMVLPGR